MIDINNSQDVLFQKALKKHQNGEYHDALNLYQELLIINPNIAALHNNIGLIHIEFNKKQLALQCFLTAINIDGNFVEAHNNLGILYEEQGDFNKAISHCQTAIKIKPDFSNAYINLGSSFDEIGKRDLAIESYKKSIELDPNSVESYNNLGSIFRYSGDYEKAIKYYQKAIQINKNYPKARKNIGLVYLLLYNFHKGFEEFEWRIMEKKKKEYHDLQLNSLLWNGENLDGKIILILSEQGIGDIIQFARYIFELQERYKVKIIFRTHKKLIHLFDNCKFQIINEEDSIPKHDHHIYLMSLPRFYYRIENKLLGEVNYIQNKNKFSLWKKKLSKIKLPKIGLNWQGGTIFKRDKFRSIPLNYFEPLFSLNGLEYISLQKGYGVEQIKNFKYKEKLKFFNPEFDIDKEENAFEDTIELLLNLDLVITSCTAVAHLSSTIGVKTWILLNYSADWRWFLDSNITPWYKNTKLYRQTKEGDWSQIIEEVRRDLIKEFKK